MNPYPHAKAEVRALFFDLDGTLVSFVTHHIPGSAINALQRAHRAGYMLFIATGRHLTEVRQVPQIDEIPWAGILSANGQYCQYGGQVIHTHPLPREDVLKIAAFLEENPHMPCMFATEDHLYLTGINDVVRQCHATVDVALPPVVPLSAHLHTPIYHIGLYFKDETMPAIFDDLQHCVYSRWGDRGDVFGIDLISREGGKWAGITQMAEHLGLGTNQVMVFGDNDNDIDMLTHATYSVAIAGGSREAMDAAGYVAPSVDEDGVAAALHDILDIPL